MQTVYYTWRQNRSFFNDVWSFAANQTGATTIKVRVRKSPDWIANPQNIGGSTTLRVCFGDQYNDIGISETGSIGTPPGWTGGGDSIERSFSKNIVIPTAAPLPAEYMADIRPINQLLGCTNLLGCGRPDVPYGATYAQWIKKLNDLVNAQESAPWIVYAYEVTSPTPSFQNPPGWTPKWFMKGWDEGLPTGAIAVPAPESGDLDQQMVSLFSQKISVSQTEFGMVGKAGFINGSFGGIVGLEPNVTFNPNVTEVPEITITIDPRVYVDGYPIVGGKPWEGKSYNTDTGGRECDCGETPKPSRDGPGNNPVYAFPGGGAFTPIAPEFIAIEVTPDPIAHDNTDVGTFKTKSFSVKNAGTVSVEVDSIENTHPNNIFTFGMNNPISIPFTIDPDEEFGGTSYFIPFADISYNEIGYVKNGANILRSFSITGVGTLAGNPGDPILRSISLTGDVSTSGNRNFLERTIGSTTTTDIFAVNTGSVPVILNSVSLGGSGVFTSPGVTAGFNLQPGQALPIPVNFTPVGAQEYIGTFTLNTNAETSPQTEYFNPSTGAILANLSGQGVPEEVLTRIMSFNIQNDGTFEDALAGGSATTELDGTITNIGNSSLLISQFQVQSPFSLELDAIGTYTVGDFEFYSLDEPLILAAGATSPTFTIKFTPPTATNYVDDVLVVSNKTLGPEAFEVRGTGTFEFPVEPDEPEIPDTPDDEPPPGQEFDPGTVPSSALDGNGSACIPKECEVVYVYEYSSNGEIVT